MMIKSQVRACIERCIAAGCSHGFWPDAAAGAYVVEVPKREEQGDFSTNFALVSAGKMKAKPRDIAAKLAGWFTQIASLPETQQFYAHLGATAMSGGPEQMRRFQADEIALWKRIAAQAKIELQ